MGTKEIVAGPGQVIGELPREMDDGLLIDGVADGLIGHWAFATPGTVELSHRQCGECPFCYSPLYKPTTRPYGRMIQRLGRVAGRTDVAVLIDILPATLQIAGCGQCRLAFTWDPRSHP